MSFVSSKKAGEAAQAAAFYGIRAGLIIALKEPATARLLLEAKSMQDVARVVQVEGNMGLLTGLVKVAEKYK